MTIVESDWMDWGDESRHAPFTSSSCLKGPKLGGTSFNWFVRPPFTLSGGHAESVARVWHRTALGHSYCMHMYFMLLTLCMPTANTLWSPCLSICIQHLQW